MARIRSIKPEFFTSEQIVECSMNARLLFIGLWTFADDAGRHPASAKRLQMEVFPGDPLKPSQLAGWMGELIRVGLVIEYEVKGESYWQVTGWNKHQKIERPTVKYPDPFGEHSTICRRGIDDTSPPERKGEESRGVEPMKDMSAGADASVGGVGQLRDWLRWWNVLRGEGMVQAGVNEESPSEAIRAAWTRSHKNREVRELLAQRDALESRIRKSSFCREGWFRLEKLFGAQNRDRELIAKKLLDGGYEDSRNGNRPLLDAPRGTTQADLDAIEILNL